MPDTTTTSAQIPVQTYVNADHYLCIEIIEIATGWLLIWGNVPYKAASNKKELLNLINELLEQVITETDTEPETDSNSKEGVSDE